MIVADTSVWISFLKNDDPDTVDILRAYLKKDQVFAVSAIFGELYQGVRNRREYDIINQINLNIPHVDEHELFLDAGHLSNKFKLYAKGVGFVDCYILAACIENELALWTKDKKLQLAYEDVLSS